MGDLAKIIEEYDSAIRQGIPEPSQTRIHSVFLDFLQGERGTRNTGKTVGADPNQRGRHLILMFAELVAGRDYPGFNEDLNHLTRVVNARLGA